MISYAPDVLAEKLSQAVFHCFPTGVILPGDVYGRCAPEDQERFRAIAVHFCMTVLANRDEFWTSESEAVALLLRENAQLKLAHDAMQAAYTAMEARLAQFEPPTFPAKETYGSADVFR